jgi:hypothetical protein
MDDVGSAPRPSGLDILFVIVEPLMSGESLRPDAHLDCRVWTRAINDLSGCELVFLTAVS